MSALLRVLALGAVAAAVLVAPSTTVGAPAAMHLTIVIEPALHGDEVAVPANVAVRAGGTVTITFRNRTHVFHTFTVRRLGLSTLIRPMSSASVTFVAQYGVYRWVCLLCATHVHPHVHSMKGTIYAIVNA